MRLTLRGLAAAAIALHAAAALAADDGFRVVVHPSNRTAEALTRAQVSQLFLKKATRWADGKPVQPVEPADVALRERFCRKVHGKSAAAIKSFWIQQLFAGREVPPVEKDTESEVLALVRKDPNAIGYVSAGANVSGLKVLSPKE